MVQVISRAARDLRSGDRLSIGRKFVTISFVWHRPARADRRYIELLTRGRDLEGTVEVEAKNDEGHTVRHEFGENEVVSILAKARGQGSPD